MDPFTFIIGITLILIGATLIGYPLGKLAGGREVARAIADESFGDVPTVVRAAQKRLDEKDVLNEEVIEEFEIWDEYIEVANA